MKFLSLLSTAILVMLTFLSACTSGGAPAGDGATENKPAPAFVLKDTEGKTVSLADFKGKIVILDFWATWCRPCRQVIPNLIQLNTKYHDKGVVVLGISLDRQPEKILPDFIKQNNINYPILISDDKVVAQYGGIQYIPTMFFIDKKGNIHAKHVGGVDMATLEKTLGELI